jgi:TRAP-type C4-dicarboxylate transport system permease small subunit
MLKLARGIERSLDVLIGALLALMVASMATQVFGRYVIGWAPIWSEEVARFLMFWITLLGGAAALRSGGHIAITSLLMAVTPSVRRVLLWLRDLAMVATFGVLGWNGWQFAAINLEQESAALEIPMGWPYAALFVGAGLMALMLALARLGGETVALTEDNSTGL